MHYEELFNYFLKNCAANRYDIDVDSVDEIFYNDGYYSLIIRDPNGSQKLVIKQEEVYGYIIEKTMEAE